MYSRPQNYRYTGNVNLPQNYSGNAFLKNADNTDESAEDTPHIDSNDENKDEINAEKAEPDSQETISLLPKNGLKLRSSSLFGNKKGFGSEELLIIAIILLLFDSDENDDLFLFLIFLLFIG